MEEKGQEREVTIIGTAVSAAAAVVGVVVAIAAADSWFIATGAAAVATIAVTILWRKWYRRLRRRVAHFMPAKTSVFVSIQVSHLDDTEYASALGQAIRLCRGLREDGHDVYSFNELYPDRRTLIDAWFDAPAYLAELRARDYFVAIISKATFSSIYYEAAVATEHGKQCIFLVPDVGVMPLVMRNQALAEQNVHVCIAQTVEEAAFHLRRILRARVSVPKRAA
jgi:hypothetical protein